MGYCGGSRVGPHLTHSHNVNENDDNNHNRLSLSNSNLGEIEDDNNDTHTMTKTKNSSILSSIAINADFESVIRSLQPLAIRQKKTKS
ncbi:unnamed protein product, partial [Rotaria sp. Silwood1]